VKWHVEPEPDILPGIQGDRQTNLDSVSFLGDRGNGQPWGCPLFITEFYHEWILSHPRECGQGCTSHWRLVCPWHVICFLIFKVLKRFNRWAIKKVADHHRPFFPVRSVMSHWWSCLLLYIIFTQSRSYCPRCGLPQNRSIIWQIALFYLRNWILSTVLSWHQDHDFVKVTLISSW